MDGFPEIPQPESGVCAAGGDQPLGGVASYMGQLRVVTHKGLQQGSRLHIVQVGLPEKEMDIFTHCLSYINNENHSLKKLPILDLDTGVTRQSFMQLSSSCKIS